MKDYYRILDVEADATAAEIKTAYRRLARKYHPDVSILSDAEERFKEIVEAYDTLGDPVKRTGYDFGYCRAGELGPSPDWERQFSEFFSRDDGAGRCDLDNLFAMIERGAARFANLMAATQGRDTEINAHITLEEAAHGTELDLELTAQRAGSLPCDGHTVRVRIPPGASNGQKLLVPGTNDAQGDAPGDVLVTIALRPHPLFRADGHDLTLELPVTPWEAALGTSLDVPTLDGRVKLRIPAGTQANRKLRLAGRGLPKPDGGSGDLYAHVQIVTPSALSDRERALYAELARASSFEPRGHFA